MKTEIVANNEPQGPYMGDPLLDAWEGVEIAGYMKYNLADLHRSIAGIRELTHLLSQDDIGREQMDDGAAFEPMTYHRRWCLNQAIKLLIHSAEFTIEKLPDELKKNNWQGDGGTAMSEQMQTNKVDDKAREAALFQAANDAALDLFKIKGVAQMLNLHRDIDQIGFPDDVAGGIGALAEMADAAYARLSKAL